MRNATARLWTWFQILTVGLTGVCAAKAADQPNIILFYVDDWAWNGTPVRMDERMQNSAMPSIIEMPNLESMAAQGMVFRNAYGSPQCSPARASVLTGQSNPRNGYTVYMNGSDYYDTSFEHFPVVPNGADSTLDPDTTTIPEALAELGYVSALYGKWHNRGDPEDEFGEGNAPTPPPGIDGSTSANKPGQTISGSSLDGISDPKLMNWITDHGLQFIEEQAAAEKPFFLMLSHYAMHEGRECFPETRARYQNLPEIVEFNGGETNPDNINRRQDPAVWLGMAYELDQKIGAVRQKLVDLGIADNTYVVVVSDNGYREDFFDEIYGLPQPLHAHKWWLWQGGIRVPMIVTGPGIEPGTRCTANVVNYDFLPTFYEWAGGDPSTLAHVDGISLAGLMAGDPVSDDFLNRSLYFHYPHYRDNMPHSVIVRGLEKVVYFYETPVTHPGWEPIMYFDLGSDVGEFHNIYPENPERAEELYSDLTNYLAQVGARIPLVPNPEYDPAVYQADNGYDYRMSRGPFIGTRTPESDEWIISYAEYWMNSWGIDLGAKTNDFDGDGIENLMEYATGGDPTDALNPGLMPDVELNNDSIQISHVERTDDSNLLYLLEESGNLAEWNWLEEAETYTIGDSGRSAFERIVNSVPLSSTPTYIRLKVGETP